MTYMRRSGGLVKGLLLHCIINISFTYCWELSLPNNPEFNRFTFPKHRDFKLDFDFSLRVGAQFGLIFMLRVDRVWSSVCRSESLLRRALLPCGLMVPCWRLPLRS
jgi:hypothetical protein